MNTSIFRKSFIVGLIGAVVLGFYVFLKIGSDGWFVEIIAGLAAFVGLVVLTTSTMVILFIKARNPKFSYLYLVAIILVDIVLLFGAAQIWL